MCVPMIASNGIFMDLGADISTRSSQTGITALMHSSSIAKHYQKFYFIKPCISCLMILTSIKASSIYGELGLSIQVKLSQPPGKVKNRNYKTVKEGGRERETFFLDKVILGDIISVGG